MTHIDEVVILIYRKSEEAEEEQNEGQSEGREVIMNVEGVVQVDSYISHAQHSVKLSCTLFADCPVRVPSIARLGLPSYPGVRPGCGSPCLVLGECSTNSAPQAP